MVFAIKRKTSGLKGERQTMVFSVRDGVTEGVIEGGGRGHVSDSLAPTLHAVSPAPVTAVATIESNASELRPWSYRVQ